MIYVVYYRFNQEFKILRSFQQASRAYEYLTTLQAAPFPGQDASGYALTMVELN